VVRQLPRLLAAVLVICCGVPFAAASILITSPASWHAECASAGGAPYGQAAVAAPTIRVTASCTADPPATCVQLRVLDAASHQRLISPAPQNGTATVDGIVDLSAFNSFLTTLTFEATDSSGGVTTKTEQVYVETSPRLTALVSGDVDFYDASAAKFLLSQQGDHVKLVDRATGVATEVGSFDGTCAGQRIISGAVMPAGAIWQEDTHGSGIDIYSSRNGATSEADSYSTTTPSLRSAGDFAAWTYYASAENYGCVTQGYVRRYQSSTGITTALNHPLNLGRPSILGNLSVAPNGDLVWVETVVSPLSFCKFIWNYLYLYHQGQLTDIRNGPLGFPIYSNPVTDGINVLYTAGWDGVGPTYRYDPAGDELLSSSGGPYAVANGWIAFTRKASNYQLWVRSPLGVETELTETSQQFALDGLSDTGEVMYTYGGRRYVAAAGQIAIDIGSSLGRAFWRDGQWYVQIGRTLFGVNTADRARLTIPDESQPLPGSSVVFSWRAIGASQYWLDVGTSLGGTQLYSAGQGAGVSRTVEGLPADGSTIYVRLWTLANGRWLYDERTFTAVTAGLRALLLRPAHGLTLASSSVTFTWSAGPSGSTYWLDVGRTAGASDVYAGGQGGALSRTINDLPIDGSSVYVRLWTLTGGHWLFADYTYTAASSPGHTMLIHPAEGEVLTNTAVAFSWTEVAGAVFWLDIGTSTGGADLYSASQGTECDVRVDGLPMNGRKIYVRLWMLQGGTWESTDYEYDTIDALLGATLANPVDLNLPSPTALFTWTPADATPSVYWLDVGSTPGGTDVYSASQGQGLTALVEGLPGDGAPLHVRLWTLQNSRWTFVDYSYSTAHPSGAALLLTPAQGETVASRSASFTWSSGLGAQQYWIDVGTTPGGTDVYSRTQNLDDGTRIDRLPANGDLLYVRLWTLQPHAWIFVDYVFTTADPSGGAVLVRPTPDLPLAGDWVTLEWSAGGLGGRVPSTYWLDVGTIAAGNDLYVGGNTGTRTARVGGLPRGGQRVHVRLWTLFAGVDSHWVIRDYVYRTTPSTDRAQLISPEDGDTLAAGATTFSWTTVPAAIAYWLDIGTAAAASDVYSATQALATATTVTGLPSGTTLFARLWTLRAGAWTFVDYSFNP
jgi:hypothetical protein